METKTIFTFIIFLFCQLCFAQNNISNYLSKAETFEKMQKRDSAIFILEKGIASLPIDSAYKLYLKHGYISMSLQKDSIAEKDFRIAAKIFPSAPEAYAAFGYLFMKVGRFRESLQNFNKAYKLGDKSESLIFCRGHTYWDLKICDSATIAMNQTIAMNPRHENGNYLRGRISAYLGNYKTALEDYAIGLQLVPLEKQPEVYGYRGISLFALKRYQEAFNDLEMSTKGGMKREEILTCYENVKKVLGKK